ncbi:MAG: universal stress protein [Candidatus Sericytochromatia bacterium]|nr:universal stress protein [Candidatus Sericytochromatia bacterium]
MQEIRLTVALDLTDLDKQVLAYTAFICRSLPVSKLYFVHVEEHLDLPDSLLRKHPDMLPVDESLESQMRQAVQQHLKLEREIDMDFDALQGKVFEQVLKHIKMKQADLLVVGKRGEHFGPHEMPAAKLARHATCSVLFVPENYSLDIKNILVPVDFSAHAKQAVEMALGLSSQVQGDKIHLLHIYNVPEGYQRLGETYEEANEVMLGYAKEDCQHFVDQLENPDLNALQYSFTDQNDRPRDEIIREYLEQLDCQLLVMGSKGRTNIAAFLMGSLAEKLSRAYLGNVPVMIVKKKHENMGLLDTLLQISKA